MPPFRSASSLSFAEPNHEQILQDWVDRSVSEGISKARSDGAPTLYVSTKKLDWDLDLGAFESSVGDVHFFGSRDMVLLGLGVARAFEPTSLKVLGSRAMRKHLGLDSLSAGDTSKVKVVGGWGFPHALGGKGGDSGATFRPRAGSFRPSPSPPPAEIPT